ncbi:MAG TPA: VWA domain-containing protein [Thermoanaerobaculia bacterium]|nr:VWA domain-containing protein [Thermoanaerobaculia bacterium]
MSGGRAVTVLLAAALLSVAAPAPAADAAVDTPESATAEAAADLPARYRQWLEEVAPLISPEERAAFLALDQDYRRQAFIRRFWELRDPFPETPRNELRDRWQERVAAARERWDDLTDERARMLLLHGPPERVVAGRCGALLRPLEAWSWSGTDLTRTALTLAFVASGGDRQGRYRLWRPGEGLLSLLLLPPAGTLSDHAAAEAIRDQCLRGDELLGALAGAADWQQLEERGVGVPRPDAEWVAAFADRSTAVPEGAATLPAELSIDFPGRHQSRTVVATRVEVPRRSAGVGGSDGEPVHSFLLDGEVLRQGELFDAFRYRFDLPARQATDTLPLQVERYLRPGEYQLILRLEDLHGGGFFRREQELAVPVVAGPGAAGAARASADPVPPAAGNGSAAGQAPPEEAVVKLSSPPDQLHTGRVRVAAQVRGQAVARVRFELDGKPVLTKTRAPYSVELDLGREPRLRTLRAVAEAADGEALASDEIAFNAGPHRFSVRLVEPRGGGPLPEVLRAQAVVEVPDSDRLDRVEFFVDDERLATLYQPPFVQPLRRPAGDEPSFVRVVAHLAEGGSAEDLVYLHAPDNLDRMDVDLVELYTTVVDRRGRPVSGLAADDFRVREDGREQPLLRFEWVENLPVHAAVLIDTSTSMVERLRDAERAALRFFDELLTPRDRAAVITFNDQPQLKVRFTSDVEVLSGGLAGLRAEGETALYDSLIYSLYYFGGIRGKRLLVLLSDGEDVKSRYRFEEVLEFARRSGVAIYTIGMSLPTSADSARMALGRLASETGGRSFFTEGAAGLGDIYRAIEEELRAQYLLAYQSDQSDGAGFRRIEVEVQGRGLSARTLAGYYP